MEIEYKLTSVISANKELQGRLESLNLQLVNLESENSKMKRQIVINEVNETTIDQLKGQITELTTERNLLKKQLETTRSSFEEKMDIIKREYEENKAKLNKELDNVNFKFENVRKYELYIKTLEKVNMEMSNKIDNLENEYEKSLIKAKEMFNLKSDYIRKNAVESLFVARKNIQEQTIQKNSNTHKLHLIQIKELSNELVRHAEIIEDLQQKNLKKDKIIFALKAQNEIHKEVERNLETNNRKIAKMISTAREEKPKTPVQEKKEPFKSQSTFYRTNLKEMPVVEQKGISKIKWYVDLVDEFLPWMEEMKGICDWREARKEIETCLSLVRAFNSRLRQNIKLDRDMGKLTRRNFRKSSVDFNILSKFENSIKMTGKKYFEVNKSAVENALR